MLLWCLLKSMWFLLFLNIWLQFHFIRSVIKYLIWHGKLAWQRGRWRGAAGRFDDSGEKLGEYDCPTLILSENEEHGIGRSWLRVVIVKLLGRKIGFKAKVKTKLRLEL